MPILTKKNALTHGHTCNNQESHIYRVWRTIIGRCTNSNNNKYPIYGGRGIRVCKRWRKFSNFLMDMGEPPTKNHSLDRINNNDNYCKENCRWATSKQQNRNRRNNLFATYNGRTQLVIDWAEEYKILYHTLLWRLKHNWSMSKALKTPIRNKRKGGKNEN